MRQSARTLVLLAGVFLISSFCLPQTDGTQKPRIYYPQPLSLWNWQKSVGLAVSTLPQEIVEAEMNQSPAIDFQSRVGLPLNFSFDGRVVTQILTTHLNAGATWSHIIDRFAFSAGYDFAFWFGFLTVEGFDNSANGWLNYPHISVGYDFGNFRFSVKAEAVLVLSFESYAGKNLISSDRNTFGGLMFTFALEQPFWKSQHVVLSFKAAFVRFHYQSWFTYETFDRFLFTPEISFGFFL